MSGRNERLLMFSWLLVGIAGAIYGIVSLSKMLNFAAAMDVFSLAFVPWAVGCAGAARIYGERKGRHDALSAELR